MSMYYFGSVNMFVGFLYVQNYKFLFKRKGYLFKC